MSAHLLLHPLAGAGGQHHVGRTRKSGNALRCRITRLTAPREETLKTAPGVCPQAGF